MQEIIDYKVIVVSDEFYHGVANKLETDVKKHIRDGWKPFGGVSIERISPDGRYEKYIMTQAMIK